MTRRRCQSNFDVGSSQRPRSSGPVNFEGFTCCARFLLCKGCVCGRGFVLWFGSITDLRGMVFCLPTKRGSRVYSYGRMKALSLISTQRLAELKKSSLFFAQCELCAEMECCFRINLRNWDVNCFRSVLKF